MTNLELTQTDLQAAQDAGHISPAQATTLWGFWLQRAQTTADAAPASNSAPKAGLNVAHLLYYLGGLIAIGAISFFITSAWSTHGAWPLLVLASGAALIGWALTRHFSERAVQPIPAGLMAALTVTAVPLAVFSLQHILGQWGTQQMDSRDYHRYIDARWIYLELATLAAGAAVLWRFKLPFSTMPIAVTLWYMSMDLTPLLANDAERVWELRKWVSVWFGLAMMVLSVYLDWRSGQVGGGSAALKTAARGSAHPLAARHDGPQDFGYWIMLFGAIAFWGGLSSTHSDGHLSKALYALICLGGIAGAVLLKRGVLAVCGGFGLAGYLGYLSYTVFRDSLLFPVALGALGIALVFAGLWWHKNQARLHARFGNTLPDALQSAVNARA